MIGEGLLAKKPLIVLICLMVSSALLAHDHPWPPPIATFDVTDIGSRTFPLTFSGTASLYVDRKPDGTVSSWVEGDHMKTANVSDKTITKMVIEVRWQDAHGEGTSLIHYHIDLTDPPPDESLVPGASRSVGGAHRPVPKVDHEATEFDKLAVAKPQLRIHAVSVTFSDGSSYSEPSDHKERPW
jgi:hypothetical protein